MSKQKKDKKGPSGMVKRTTFIKPDPPPLPPEIGAVIWYRDKREQWRTGRLIRVVDRGQNWGKIEVKDSVSGGLVKVAPEHVLAPVRSPKKSLERGV